MPRRIRVSMLGVSVLAAALLCLATNARCRSLDLLLNKSDKANLDLAASHVAQKIQEAKLAAGQPTVLVIDSNRGSVGTSSLPGSQVADRFSASLTDFLGGFRDVRCCDQRRPGGLNCKAVQNWNFRPAQKDGKSVTVRVPIETTFRPF